MKKIIISALSLSVIFCSVCLSSFNLDALLSLASTTHDDIKMKEASDHHIGEQNKRYDIDKVPSTEENQIENGLLPLPDGLPLIIEHLPIPSGPTLSPEIMPYLQRENQLALAMEYGFLKYEISEAELAILDESEPIND